VVNKNACWCTGLVQHSLKQHAISVAQITTLPQATRASATEEDLWPAAGCLWCSAQLCPVPHFLAVGFL
jgi:hypothetical protein